jgi:ABC-type oligopeptide transport system ATPase subunit
MLVVEALTKEFLGARKGLARRGPPIKALDGVSLEVLRGESFGLVGESGSGKTTLTRCVLRLEPASSGRILFDGADLSRLSAPAMRRLRARLQIVFQDPYASLDPRMSVRDIVSEPMWIHREALSLSREGIEARARELIELVGLSPLHLGRFPHEFSGGQRQRIGIARALSVRPEFLILDEPTSALDVSVQAQILNLLHDLQKRLHLTYLFISHDLGVIRHVCDRVALIHRGRIVEEGDTEEVFLNPRSDYARLLIAAMPDPDPDRSPLRRVNSAR